MKIHIGRVERVFALLLIIYLVASYFNPPGLIVLGLITLVLGVAVFVRMAQGMVKQMLWRLRNRLIVAYFFIALVPIILITLLAGLGGYLIGGQLSIYLVTSELERRTSSLRNNVDFLARGAELSDRAPNFSAFLRSRYPGLELLVEDSEGVWKWPDGVATEPPPRGWRSTSGLVMRKEMLCGWARIVRNGRVVTAVFPLTRDYLGALLPDLGESWMRLLPHNRSVLHSIPADPENPTRNRLPPKAHSLDFEISWSNPISVALWQKPEEATDAVWFGIRTRPSAVWRTVVTQKLDFANETIPLLFFLVATLFMVAEIIALMIGVSITRTITGAVHDLYVGTQHVARGDFSHRIPIRGKDQLTELSASLNQMAGNMERLLTIEKERAGLQAELEIAREVQNQLYPKQIPSMPSLKLTAVCKPARMVSGDYYDYQQLGPDKVAIAVGDVAGKGISAALLMATVQSSFRTQLRGSIGIAADAGQGSSRLIVSTSAVVSHLNRQLHADTAPEKFATFVLGVYDSSSGSFTYTNAGHLPPILVHGTGTTRLDVNGMVVGAFAFAKYDESTAVLQPGDRLVFFTDGVSEAENEYGEMFGEDRLTELVLRMHRCPDDEIIESIAKAVRQWTGSDELQDDLTLLLLRRC